MRAYKFKLNYVGHFQPENIKAKLGHPIYQVINVPDDVSQTACMIRLDNSCLMGDGVTYNYPELGFGRFVKAEENK